MVKNKNTTKCFLKQVCLFDFGLIWVQISLESENTSQYSWKPPLFHWNLQCAMTQMESTSTTKWPFREPTKAHYIMEKYITCDTHSAHLFSSVSAGLALLFCPPRPSLFVQCYTERTKNLHINTDQSSLLGLCMHVLHKKRQKLLMSRLVTKNKNLRQDLTLT